MTTDSQLVLQTEEPIRDAPGRRALRFAALPLFITAAALAYYLYGFERCTRFNPDGVLSLQPLFAAAALSLFPMVAAGALLYSACEALAQRRSYQRPYQCLTCGYTVGVATLCPECGRPPRLMRDARDLSRRDIALLLALLALFAVLGPLVAEQQLARHDRSLTIMIPPQGVTHVDRPWPFGDVKVIMRPGAAVSTSD